MCNDYFAPFNMLHTNERISIHIGSREIVSEALQTVETKCDGTGISECSERQLPHTRRFFSIQISNQTKSMYRFIYPNLSSLFVCLFFLYNSMSWSNNNSFRIKSIIHVISCYFQYWSAHHFLHQIATVTAFNFHRLRQTYWPWVSQENVHLSRLYSITTHSP